MSYYQQLLVILVFTNGSMGDEFHSKVKNDGRYLQWLLLKRIIMMVRVCGSIILYIDAGVDTPLPSEVVCDVVLSWEVSMKVCMINNYNHDLMVMAMALVLAMRSRG